MWREFVWGAFAGAFGEGMMHPIDTLKTRLQSQAIISGCQVHDFVVSQILQLAVKYFLMDYLLHIGCMTEFIDVFFNCFTKVFLMS